MKRRNAKVPDPDVTVQAPTVSEETTKQNFLRENRPPQIEQHTTVSLQLGDFAVTLSSNRVTR